MDERRQEIPQNSESREWSGGLILVRKINQTILASNGAKITVLDIERDRVKLGFKCPADLIVIRGEIADDFEMDRRKSTPREGSGRLILTRKIDQRVNVGDNMVVQVLGLEWDRAKIGIKASDKIRVMRAELITSEELAVFNATGSLPAKPLPKQIS